jgi:hypothetical protein
MDLIGDPAEFAIEYEVVSVSMAAGVKMVYGHVRLWLGNEWFADIREAMFLDYLCDVLNSLQQRCAKYRLLFKDLASVPSPDSMQLKGGWSFGEAFDDFDMIYYAVVAAGQIYFQWSLDSQFTAKYPGYSLDRHRHSVSFEAFDRVVNEFLGNLGKKETGPKGTHTD